MTKTAFPSRNGASLRRWSGSESEGDSGMRRGRKSGRLPGGRDRGRLVQKSVRICKILKQIADSDKDRVVHAFGRLRSWTLSAKSCCNKRLRTAVSRSEAKFFLDTQHRFVYHDPKFSSGFLARMIFHLRAPEKLVNWRSCVEAGVALLFDLCVAGALLVEGRQRNG
jgi:hypothetical protein